MALSFNNIFLCIRSVTPDEWQDFSNKNVLKAEREKNASINLRSVVDGVLMQTYNDLKKQFDIVNLAFAERIEETEKTKTKLETHLTKVSNHSRLIQYQITFLC